MPSSLPGRQRISDQEPTLPSERLWLLLTLIVTLPLFRGENHDAVAYSQRRDASPVGGTRLGGAQVREC